MSALTDRIAEVLRQHVAAFKTYGPDDTRISQDDLAAHVAERIAEALQLTEENRTLTDGWIQPTRNAAYYAMGMEPPPAVITHERRWVSKWAAVEEQPPPAGFAPICEGCGGVKNRHFYGCSRAAVDRTNEETE